MGGTHLTPVVGSANDQVNFDSKDNYTTKFSLLKGNLS